MTLAQRARFALRLSRDEFARLLGVSVQIVQAWERRRREPTGPATTLLVLLAAEPAARQRALLALAVQPERRGRIERAWSAIWREHLELRDEEREGRGGDDEHAGE